MRAEKIYKLEKFPLRYENDISTNYLQKIIKLVGKPPKVKEIRNGHLAQVKVRIPPENKREEISCIARTRHGALEALFTTLRTRGFRERRAKRTT